MNKHFLPLLALALGVTVAGTAQVKEKPKKEKEESFTPQKSGKKKKQPS
jgi:hypothetical protein